MVSRISEAEFDRLEKIINDECHKVIKVKGVHYHRSDDVLRNFKAIAARKKRLTKYDIWDVYFTKHIDAITNAIEDNPDDPAAVAANLRGNIIDGINYLKFLAVSMYEEGHEPFGALEESEARHDFVGFRGRPVAHKENCAFCGTVDTQEKLAFAVNSCDC